MTAVAQIKFPQVEGLLKWATAFGSTNLVPGSNAEGRWYGRSDAQTNLCQVTLTAEMSSGCWGQWRFVLGDRKVTWWDGGGMAAQTTSSLRGNERQGMSLVRL